LTWEEVSSPQANPKPDALTSVKVVVCGAIVSPVVSRPQHVACPVGLIPQAKLVPTLIEPTPGASGGAVSGALLANGAADALTGRITENIAAASSAPVIPASQLFENNKTLRLLAIIELLPLLRLGSGHRP
jgi:hypothetical protein